MAAVEHSSLSPEAQALRARYVRPPVPVHFPASEEMPETNRHLELRTALYLLLKRELAARATIGSEQFVYYDPTTATKSLAPDAFVKLGPPHAPFRIWKTWKRGAPDLAVEVVSDSDAGEESFRLKLERYRDSGTGEVVRFDPDDADQPVRVWDNVDGDLVERRTPEDGVFECTALGLFWVVLPHPDFVQVLRLARDRGGRDLLPTPEEAEHTERVARQETERARQETERARQEEARARQEAERERDRLAIEVAELRSRLEEEAKGKARTPAKKTSAKRGG